MEPLSILTYCDDFGQIPPDNRTESQRHDFYRCASCKSIITALEELSLFARPANGGDVPLGEQITPGICQCGGRRYSPTNPIGEPPNDSLEPGAGKELPKPEAEARFLAAFEGATQEWIEPKVVRLSWLRYRGLA